MARKKKEVETPAPTDRAAQFAVLKKQFETIGESPSVQPVPRNLIMPMSTISLDILTNEGGLRPSSIVEWYGPWGTNKTRNALQMIAKAQLWAPDKSTAYFDIEGDVDLYVARSQLGVLFGNLPDGTPRFDYWPDPERDPIPNMGQILDRVHDYAASGLFSLIVLDSVAACMGSWEQKQDDITATRFGGAVAMDLSTSFRKIKPVCKRTGTRLLLINQQRTKQIQTPQGPMSKDEPSGGNALKYAASHRFKTGWKQRALEDGQYAFLKITGEKIKFGKSDRTIEVPVLNGVIDPYADLIARASEYGVVDKAGSWYSYQGGKLGQGLAAAAWELYEKPLQYAEIYAATIEKACPVPTGVVEVDEEEASDGD